MKKSIVLFLILFTRNLFVYGQVPKKIVVEHFTNTRCSICAGRNPGFYTNLANHPEVLHIAIHPSAPYPSCVLNQHNVQENDSRTNYYNVYGGTPNLLINGELISSSSSFSSAAIFEPYQNLVSPVSIRIEQKKYGNDSISSKIILKTVAGHTLNNLALFVALVEDTVFYNAPNGENLHHDVFRKSLTGANGISFSIATNVGDSVTYIKSSASDSAWNFARINTFVILQDAMTKSVVQSEYLSERGTLITTIQKYDNLKNSIKVFMTDPENKVLTISGGAYLINSEFILSDLSGRVLLTENILSPSQMIDIPGICKGIYLYCLKTRNEILKTGKLLVD